MSSGDESERRAFERIPGNGLQARLTTVKGRQAGGWTDWSNRFVYADVATRYLAALLQRHHRHRDRKRLHPNHRRMKTTACRNTRDIGKASKRAHQFAVECARPETMPAGETAAGSGTLSSDS
jgi:hypothetical protein